LSGGVVIIFYLQPKALFTAKGIAQGGNAPATQKKYILLTVFPHFASSFRLFLLNLQQS
jgi:hypothetical protein